MIPDQAEATVVSIRLRTNSQKVLLQPLDPNPNALLKPINTPPCAQRGAHLLPGQGHLTPGVTPPPERRQSAVAAGKNLSGLQLFPRSQQKFSYFPQSLKSQRF